MPATFPMPTNPSVIPIVRTRKALLILDMQNDFLSSDGALYTEEPDGYVDRILELAKTFRDSGAGDVIWVRSEFDRHCSLLEDGDQIVTSDIVVRSQKGLPTRGRPLTSSIHDCAAMEADEEAFLSTGGDEDKKPCVRKDTRGAEFAPKVKAAIVAGRDILFTKTHYSAFATGQQQLVQLLRTRFVTQLYVCGALTNISIYATALDAGRHGYDMTIVEDCCGFRSPKRHINALRQLKYLGGCEDVLFETLMEQLQTPPSPKTSGLSPAISKIGLDSGGGSPNATPAAPTSRRTTRGARRQPQDPGEHKPATPSRRVISNHPRPESDATRPSRNRGLIEVDSAYLPSDSESRHSPARKPKEAERNAPPAAPRPQSELESPQGPILPPGPGSAKAEKPRVINRVRQVHRPNKDKKSSTAASDGASQQGNAHPPSKPQVKPPPETTSPPAPKPESVPPLPPAPPAPGHVMAEQSTSVCSEPLCEGDTTIIANVLPPGLAADAFERLLEEVSWAGMSHMGGEVPRRIAVQGAVAEDGSMPVYRHPADESPPLLPFSPTVLQIKNEIEQHLGHELNHVLIQHYRTGNDYISEHSDKTLDIVPGTFIANVSLGAERTMIFRTKRPPKDKPSPSKKDDQSPAEGEPTPSSDAEKKRQTIRAPLPHNSLCRMGLATNARWLHAIRQDKRADRDKSASELSHSGARISLTFRKIGTFIDASQSLIWGQGATAKSRADAQPVINGQTEEAVRMLQAFGAENNKSEFDWAEWYGKGFDVLHMGVPKRFFASTTADPVHNASVGIALAELGVGCAKGSVEGAGVRFEDNDPGREAVVEGWGVVLRYLDAVYGAGRRYDQMLPGEVARRFGMLERGLDLLGKWRRVVKEAGVDEERDGRGSEEKVEVIAKLLKKELAEWDGWAKEAAAAAATTITTSSAKDGKPTTSNNTTEKPETSSTNASFYIANTTNPSPADFALWPVLHDMVKVCGDELLGESLRLYYAAFKERSSVGKVLGVGAAGPAAAEEKGQSSKAEGKGQ
ncbi:hypothetical protein VTI74DRAFT_6957 [Chaetomium olivicolor]